jgi:NAD(P)-dependent dehydrogenase (short-subunit alcohol dehydrogenase family)
MQDFEGRVAVVTGAASGIGRGIARACAREGMRVVLADVDERGLEELGVELREAGVEAITLRTDVRHPAEVDALARRTLDAFGTVDLVCNNAGVMLGGHAWERSEDDWRWVIDVNLLGVVNGLRTFLPILLARGEPAHVVNTASIGGLMVGPFLSPYIVSKHAVVALSEAAFHELATLDTPVRISVLCPGAVATGIADSARIRPGDVAHTTPLRTPAEQEFDRFVRAGVSAGMPPDEVGSILFEGLRAGRFWIYTHPLHEASIRARFESMLAGSDPVYEPGQSREMLDPDGAPDPRARV